MTSLGDIMTRAGDWIETIFGDHEGFIRSGLPESVPFLLASLMDASRLAFKDWTVANQKPVSGRLVAVTESHVVVVEMNECPPGDADSGQLSGWVRTRSAIVGVKVRADPELRLSGRRQPGCVTVSFADGATLDLPLSHRADVPDMVRTLTPR